MKAFRTDYSEIVRQAQESIANYERERAERLKGRVHRPLFGVRISNDHGKSWKLHALCDECVSALEPPTRVKNEGSAGALNCDWCGALNEK